MSRTLSKSSDPTHAKQPPNRRRRLLTASVLVVLFVLGAESGLLLKAEIAAIHVYRKVGSPVTRTIAKCRYRPSCSAYGLEQLEQHGFWRGNLKLAARLGMCSPIGFVADQFKAPK